MKLAIFHPAARAAIRLFPEDVRRELGKAIFDLQRGESLAMPLSRRMTSVGAGVSELRVRNASGIYRAFYYTRSSSGILIFHAFVKKTRATPHYEINLAKKLLKELLHEKT